MPQHPIDTLIVGQGLAGSALAWKLRAAGEHVCVIDDGHKTSSSRVAAGLINPLAGMRFNRRPELRDWLSAADRWYAQLAQYFDRQFFHPLPMMRLFRSEQQKRFYDKRAQDEESADLIGAAFDAAQPPEPVNAPFGGFMQHHTGYVDLPLLLSMIRGWLQQDRALSETAFAASSLRMSPRDVVIGELCARRVVFCEGAQLRDNPWFDYLPLQPEKGEILNLQLADWRPAHIVNGAHWLVPLANGTVRFGATHDHKHLDTQATAEGRATLLQGFAAMCKNSPQNEVVDHQAGLRPGTSDRYPFLGRHPKYPRLWVFNGFGARGALSIPWYADALVNHLIEGAPLPAEADIARLK